MSFPRDEAWQALCLIFFSALLTFIYRKYGGVYHPFLLEQAPTGLKLFKTETYLNVYKEHRRIKSSCEVRGKTMRLERARLRIRRVLAFFPHALGMVSARRSTQWSEVFTGLHREWQKKGYIIFLFVRNLFLPKNCDLETSYKISSFSGPWSFSLRYLFLYFPGEQNVG